jgi:hypothetical protein
VENPRDEICGCGGMGTTNRSLRLLIEMIDRAEERKRRASATAEIKAYLPSVMDGDERQALEGLLETLKP